MLSRARLFLDPVHSSAIPTLQRIRHEFSFVPYFSTRMTDLVIPSVILVRRIIANSVEDLMCRCWACLGIYTRTAIGFWYMHSKRGGCAISTTELDRSASRNAWMASSRCCIYHVLFRVSIGSFFQQSRVEDFSQAVTSNSVISLTTLYALDAFNTF